MVGASPDKTKFSYGVLRVLHETGYDMIPVNPDPKVTEIRGLKVYESLRRLAENRYGRGVSKFKISSRNRSDRQYL